MPTLVDFGATGNIEMVYAADGTKLNKTASDGTVTEYAGNYIYTGNTGSSSRTLEFFNQPEGYVMPDNGSWRYVYRYRDHLDNVRLSYTDNNGTLEIVEENNYYPFGGKMKGYNFVVSPLGNSVANRWKFGGKELDESLDGAMGTYDFVARIYDEWGVRWWNIDPMAGKYNEFSPYIYAVNNPIMYVDPDGEDPINPQTGKPYKINLYRTSTINSTIDGARSNPDRNLLDRINTPFHRLFPRGQRGGDTGIWQGHAAVTKNLTTNLIVGEARNVVEGLLDTQSIHAGQNSDPAWNKAAESGTYSFVTPNYAETEFGNFDLESAQIVSVEDNMINQVINLERNEDDNFDVKSVTSFDVEKGDVKTREKKVFFGLVTKTEKYRELNVTETTQNYRNNRADGNAVVKKYKREEIIN